MILPYDAIAQAIPRWRRFPRTSLGLALMFSDVGITVSREQRNAWMTYRFTAENVRKMFADIGHPLPKTSVIPKCPDATDIVRLLQESGYLRLS